MEPIQYIRLARKWLWLVIIAAFVGGGIVFIQNTQRPSVYEANVTVAIGRFIQSPNPNAAEISIGTNLAPTYEHLVTSYDILQGTVDSLSLDMTPDDLRRRIRTRIVPDTTLLIISVQYGDPILTADIANDLAEQLILQSPTNLTPEQQAQLDLANSQIASLNEQLQASRAQLVQIDGEVAAANTREDRAEQTRLNDLRNDIVAQMNAASATIAQFNNSVTSIRQRTNSLDVVERARVAERPIGTSTVNSTVAGALVGAVLALGVGLLYEYLDDKIRTTEQAAQTLAVPVLGAIAPFGKKAPTYAQQLVAGEPTMSRIAEGYRTLRTNLLLSSKNVTKPIFVFTSANPEEGKTVTSANLAATIALAGLRVLLVDADLRRPRIHQIFQLDNSIGLTSLLRVEPKRSMNGSGAAHQIEPQFNADLWENVQNTAIPGLRVLTSGFIPANPSEILGSVLMERWIEIFRAEPEIDVVIFDTPPCLLFTDSQILASTAKASVILVVDADSTRRDAALEAKEEFTKLNIEVAGVVVNRINPHHERNKYSYTYGYYYSNYTNGKVDSKPRQGLFGWRR